MSQSNDFIGLMDEYMVRFVGYALTKNIIVLQTHFQNTKKSVSKSGKLTKLNTPNNKKTKKKNN